MLKQNIICIHYTQKSTDIIQSFYQIPILDFYRFDLTD